MVASEIKDTTERAVFQGTEKTGMKECHYRKLLRLEKTVERSALNDLELTIKEASRRRAVRRKSLGSQREKRATRAKKKKSMRYYDARVTEFFKKERAGS